MRRQEGQYLSPGLSEREPGGGPGARLKRDEVAAMQLGDRVLRAPLMEGLRRWLGALRLEVGDVA